MQPHTHDVCAMSACVPTVDVSLHRGELHLGPVPEVGVNS
jgi:hypothetical protein